MHAQRRMKAFHEPDREPSCLRGRSQYFSWLPICTYSSLTLSRMVERDSGEPLGERPSSAAATPAELKVAISAGTQTVCDIAAPGDGRSPNRLRFKVPMHAQRRMKGFHEP
jgi:hypothetical protein